jgi:hypothetical protein
MNTTTYFLYFVFACLGFAAGAIITGSRRRTPSSSAGEPTPPPEGSIEVLRVWRSADGSLQVGMDGQPLNAPTALQPDQRRRLIKTVIDLRPWLEAPTEAKTSAPAPAQAAPAQPVPAAPVEAPPPALKPAKKPAEEKPAPPVIKSIIEQIEDVLQTKLAGSALEKREIHLTEGPVGTVIVKIGLNKYEGIDAVPEPEIQALIRQAISDWEKGTH